MICITLFVIVFAYYADFFMYYVTCQFKLLFVYYVCYVYCVRPQVIAVVLSYLCDVKLSGQDHNMAFENRNNM